MPKSYRKKKSRSLKKRKQTGGDIICSNLYPKISSNQQSLTVNETIGGPAPVSSSDNVLSCSIPTPRAPVGVIPPEPMMEQMPMDGTPSAFLGRPPPRVPPSLPGPPGPGNYQPGLAGIPPLEVNQRPPQATSILHSLVDKGTFNRDYQPILNTNLVTKSTCKANPSNRSQLGGKRVSLSKKKSSKILNELKIIKSSKSLKEQQSQLDHKREELFVNGIKRKLTTSDFRKILDFLKIKYEKEDGIDKLFEILKKKRPDLVTGTGWFYLIKLFMELISFDKTKHFYFHNFLREVVPFRTIINNVDGALKTNKLKSSIREIVDSNKK